MKVRLVHGALAAALLLVGLAAVLPAKDALEGVLPGLAGGVFIWTWPLGCVSLGVAIAPGAWAPLEDAVPSPSERVDALLGLLCAGGVLAFFASAPVYMASVLPGAALGIAQLPFKGVGSLFLTAWAVSCAGLVILNWLSGLSEQPALLAEPGEGVAEPLVDVGDLEEEARLAQPGRVAAGPPDVEAG